MDIHEIQRLQEEEMEKAKKVYQDAVNSGAPIEETWRKGQELMNWILMDRVTRLEIQMRAVVQTQQHQAEIERLIGEQGALVRQLIEIQQQRERGGA